MSRKQVDRPDTRSELVEAAWELFAHNGYEGTTVNAIIEKVGLSKGAFYHYFESKEDVLDAVVEHVTEHVIEDVDPMLRDAGRDANHKLDCLISVFRSWKEENLEMVRNISLVLEKDENIIIRHKIDRRTDELLMPLLVEIITQGIEEGLYDVEDPQTAAEMVTIVFHAWREMQMRALMEAEQDGNAEDVEDKLRRRIRGMARLLERFLGAPSGTLVLMEDEAVRRFIELFG